MELFPQGITGADLDEWADETGSNIREWKLKPGAPERLKKPFKEYIEMMLRHNPTGIHNDPNAPESKLSS